jgi:tRNA (adenine57-N1/adenine58-N1)-methyltransferase
MDFSRPLESEESLATKSKIRYLPVDYIGDTYTTEGDTFSYGETPVASDNDNGNNDNNDNDSDDNNNDKDDIDTNQKSLDVMLIEAANEAATDLLLGPTKDPDPSLVDASLYTERSRPLQAIIEAGDLIVIMESFDKLTFVYAEEGALYCNRNGHFRHADFIGKPYGCKIRSHNNRGYGFCYLLKPTPELWARSLNHRTQIVHELDQAQIIFQLFIKPNMTVVESGTGSGAMSHAIMRTIAPHGFLHTFEFNAHRAETARQEFQNNGVSHLVQVHHKDVCGRVGGDGAEDTGGFDLPGQTVDAVFLDLPEPWLAVPHAAYILKANGRIASYSPCVEQTQRTVQSLKKAGFHSIKTMEYRLQEHYVDEVEYESPPKEKRPRPEPHNPQVYLTGANASGADSGHNQVEEDEEDVDTGAEADNEKSELSEAATDTTVTAPTVTAPATTSTTGSPIAVLPTTTTTATAGGNTNGNTKRKKMLVARPFTVMRGHTAFLTFATAGILPQANPNMDSM